MNKQSRTNIIASLMAIAVLIAGGVVERDFKPTYHTANAIETERITRLKKSSESESEKNVATLEVPEGDTSFKSYMDYRAITNIRSDQFKLQQDCVTDSHGLRRYGDDYVIAVGSYYSKNIGDRLTITLDNGDSFTAVVGDFKADDCTDIYHRYYAMSDGRKNIIEFIVDTDELDSKARIMGDISYIDGFSGNVIKIAKSKPN
jgi:hypothetical protein